MGWWADGLVPLVPLQDLLWNWLELSNPQGKQGARQQERGAASPSAAVICSLPRALLEASQRRQPGQEPPPQRLLAILALSQQLSCAHGVALGPQHLAPVLLAAQASLPAFSFQQLLHLSCAVHQLLGRGGFRQPGQAGPGTPTSGRRELLPGLEAELQAKRPAQLAAADALQLLWCASRMCRPSCLLDKVDGPQPQAVAPLSECCSGCCLLLLSGLRRCN
jgi:hypothetical protein